jgi:hypothetical protein
MDPYINLPAMDRKKAGHYFSFTVFNNKGDRRGGGILYTQLQTSFTNSAEQPYFPVKSLDKLSTLNKVMEMVSSFDFPAISASQNKFCEICLHVLYVLSCDTRYGPTLV